MMIRRTAGVATFALLVLVLTTCEKTLPNNNPTIISVTGPASVESGSSAQYACVATDPDGDTLTYTWSCTRGSLSSSHGATVNWTAPSTSGTANLEVTVRDGEGGTDSQAKSVTVSPRTTTLVTWDGAIQAGYYKYWTSHIAAGHRVSGSFSVDAHDITFLILDESNYTNWRNNNSYNYLVRVSRSAGSSFSATVGTSGTYYIILDNTYSIFTDKFAHLLVQSTSP